MDHLSGILNGSLHSLHIWDKIWYAKTCTENWKCLPEIQTKISLNCGLNKELQIIWGNIGQQQSKWTNNHDFYLHRLKYRA